MASMFAADRAVSRYPAGDQLLPISDFFIRRDPIIALGQRPRSIWAQRVGRTGRFCGVDGLPQIGRGRGEVEGFIANQSNQTGAI